MIALSEVVLCPMCKSTGHDYHLVHHKLLKCELCEGRGWIPTVSCRGCGRPAFKFWPPRQVPIVQYCGLEACLSAMVTLHSTKPSLTKGMIVSVKDLIDDANKRRALHKTSDDLAFKFRHLVGEDDDDDRCVHC